MGDKLIQSLRDYCTYWEANEVIAYGEAADRVEDMLLYVAAKKYIEKHG